MNFIINHPPISGFLFLVLLLFCVSIHHKVFAYKTCEENYDLFHRWYMQEPKIFIIRSVNIVNILNDNPTLIDQLKLNVDEKDFQSFCSFHNDNAYKNETYSPCNDQSYDMYSCFRRFIFRLNEYLNPVIEKYIEFGNSNYVINELNQSLICNHTINQQVFSIKDYYEMSCNICLKGLSLSTSNCSSLDPSTTTLTNKCCLLGTLINPSIGKSTKQINLENVYRTNQELLSGKYNSILKNLKSLKPNCLGEQSPDDCICPRGYMKSGKNCIDIDECSLNTSFCRNLDDDLNRKYNLDNQNLSQSMCVNTYGKFLCARITCPTNYDLKNSKCYYNSRLYYRLRIDEKFSIPKIVAFNFISLPQNVYIPDGKLELFTIDSSSNAEYYYKIHKINSINRNINDISQPYIVSTDLNRDEAELKNDFSLNYNNDTKKATLYLHNEIKSTVEAQVIIMTSWHSHDKKTFGITNIVLNIFVTN